MLQKPSDEVASCLERAACCRETANKTICPIAKADYLALEQKWMRLAKSRMWVEAVSVFLNALQKHHRILVACI